MKKFYVAPKSKFIRAEIENLMSASGEANNARRFIYVEDEKAYTQTSQAKPASVWADE